uniref:Uncharacterized protein n=1 Tax=Myripristis murdjan TaxID=586833 RepID=A0A667XLH9_9TELE
MSGCLHKLLGLHFKRVSAIHPCFTYVGLVVSHEHSEVGEVAAGAGGVCAVGHREGSAALGTCRCLSVKTTGSVRNTRLDSLLMEAAMTWEFTARTRPS